MNSVLAICLVADDPTEHCYACDYESTTLNGFLFGAGMDTPVDYCARRLYGPDVVVSRHIL